MLLKRFAYALLFIFCIWLALATRNHPSWFHPIIVKYGGDVIWAGMFLFFLRTIFVRSKARKLAVICFLLGVLDECSQLLYFDWLVAIRETYIGRLILGVGFLWSDIVCYAIGTLIAFVIVMLIDKRFGYSPQKRRVR